MILQLENAQKNYSAFSLSCSLSIKKGQITGIIGPNGAGKSTLFKAVLDLVRLDGGRIEIFGKDHKKLTPSHRAMIGTAFPDSGFSQYFTVKNIISIMDASYEKFDKAAFTKQCHHFSIPLDKKVKEFSTGMKAKLKLLLALSYDADLLILDEPTVGLDVVARNQLLDMIRDYMTEDKAILISSHIASDLETLCDDIYMLLDGRLILHEDTDVLLDRYGVLKLSREEFETIDRSHILWAKPVSYGYLCLTNEKHYYMENYPDMIIEKNTIDDVISLMIDKEAVQ